MLGNERVLGLIPARGGSKGVPRKNVRDVAGKPLIAWTIEAGLRSRYVDRLVVSTDDAEIAAVSRIWGAEVPFMRPAELARDDSPGIAPVLHALRELPGFDWLVLLQPTSPLRTAEDIDACLNACAQLGAPTMISVCEVSENPRWMFNLGVDRSLDPLFSEEERSCRRQDLPSYVTPNGAVYVARVADLAVDPRFITSGTKAYVMPPERSVDIDAELDLVIAETLLSRSL